MESADERLLALLCEQELLTRGQEARLRAAMRRGMTLAQAIAKTPLVDPVRFASLQALSAQRGAETDALQPQEPSRPSDAPPSPPVVTPPAEEPVPVLREFVPITADDDQKVALEITEEPPATVQLGDKEFILRNLGPVGTVPEPPDEEDEVGASPAAGVGASTAPVVLDLDLDPDFEVGFHDVTDRPSGPPASTPLPPMPPPDVPQEPAKPERKKGARFAAEKETDSRISRMVPMPPVAAQLPDDDTLPLPGMGGPSARMTAAPAPTGAAPMPPPPPTAAETAASRETPAEPVAIPSLDLELELDPDLILDFDDAAPAPAKPVPVDLPDDLELDFDHDHDHDHGGGPDFGHDPEPHHAEPASEELHDQVEAVLDDLFEEGESSPKNPLPPAEALAPAAESRKPANAADYEPRAARVQQYDLGDDEGIPLIGEVNGILRKAIEAKALALEFDITLQGTTQRTYDRAGSRTDEKPLDMERSQKIVNRLKVMARLEPWRRNQSQKGKCIIRSGRLTFQMLVDQEPGRDGREMLTIYFQPQ